MLCQIYQKREILTKKWNLIKIFVKYAHLSKQILVWWGKCDPPKKFEIENLIFDDGQGLKPFLGL